MDLSDRREQYETEGLDVSDVHPDPIVQFERWYRDAEAADLWEPNAMVVSTVDRHGWPTSRFILLKSFDSDGFAFFTNYESDKAEALDRSERAALTFGWLPLRRQVRVQGAVRRVGAAKSDEYFAHRPRGSQVSAWASPQSRPITGREELEGRYAEIQRRFEGQEIPRPATWGGYNVTVESIEFWQGRPNRFHDRIRFTRSHDDWLIERLAP